MKDTNVSNRDLEFVILYGSQTGTGEDVAERVGREAIRNGFDPVVSPMDTFDVRHLPHCQVLVVIASTTGQGEEPSNMKSFWKYLLRRSLPHDLLSAVACTVLGLGDSSYAKFNFVAKKLFKRLKQLGAQELTPIFLADDQHELGPDSVIDQWLPAIWTQLPARPQPNLVHKPKFSILRPSHHDYSQSVTDTVTKSVFQCDLLANRRVTSEDHFQDVRLVSIDLAASGLTYAPGDVVVVQPSNSDDMVEEFFRLFPELEAKSDEEFTLTGNFTWGKLPCQLREIHPWPWTWALVARHVFDLQSIPKRYFFELLAQFTTSDMEREKLDEFRSSAGQQDLYAYCHRPRRNVLEVLADFPHALPNIPPEYLFDLIPPIKPRSFSIASSMQAHGNELQILVAVVNYKTKLKKPRLGLCSNWLANLSPGPKVPLWILPGSFHFPPLNSIEPVIMVGPGTGIAPFRSFISARAGSGADLTLFFGCRFSDKDFYFEDEWSRLQSQGHLRLFTAFSRETPESGPTYVQHRIEEAGTQLWNLLENEGGLVYVAGNAKRMPIDVAEAFVSVFKKASPDPEGYMKQLVKEGRYQTEVWS